MGARVALGNGGKLVKSGGFGISGGISGEQNWQY